MKRSNAINGKRRKSNKKITRQILKQKKCLEKDSRTSSETKNKIEVGMVTLRGVCLTLLFCIYFGEISLYTMCLLNLK